MTDIDAPMRYAEPVVDRNGQEGHVGLVILLALCLAIAAVGLAILSRELAEPFVLAILAGLAVIGVFTLFAGAVGILHFGQGPARKDAVRAFADNLPDAVLIADSAGRVIYANEAYRDFLGSNSGTPVLSPDRALAANPYIAEQIFRLTRAAQQGKAVKEELRLPGGINGGGSAPRWFRIAVRPMPDVPGSGRKNGLLVWQIAEVTSERERQEASFEKLQAAIAYLDNASAGFFTVDGEGRVDYLNATLAQWLGHDIAELATRRLTLKDIMSDDSAALFAQSWRDVPNNGTRRIDLDLAKADGTMLPVRIMHRVSPQGSKEGLLHALVLNLAPGGAAESGAAEVRFARLFNSAPVAIATLDGDGAIRTTNAAFARLFGRKIDATSGKVLLADIAAAEGDKALRRAVDAAVGGEGMVEPVDVVLVADKDRSVRFYLSPVGHTDVEGEAAIAYAIDTTEQRALEMQFAQSQKMQAIGQLAGGIAHDFNNMLTAIIGFSDFLLLNHRPTDPAFQDIMNIKQNANRAAGLVRQLLAFSRQQTLRLELLQLGDVLPDLSELLGRLIGENVELKLETSGDLWPVRTDLNQFEQVIVNLAVNARDAMPGGGKLIIRTANVGPADLVLFNQHRIEPGDYVMIEVIDTGTGMPPEVMAKIFEPFFSTKEVGRGTGLGLSTVYGIVKQTGGYIFAESEEGAGSTMRVLLPRAHEIASDFELKKERRELPRDLTGRGTVLLVEDEDAVRSFAARALGQRGYHVLQATTGTEAIDLFVSHKGEVDLVVSDVVMPEMDGPTLMKELRGIRPELKIIFMSGYAEDSFRKNLSDKEDFRFLQKPFDLKELAAAVKAAFED
jgi:two-component system cell cycle sensor histidine kinase/response regulator CckA